MVHLLIKVSFTSGFSKIRKLKLDIHKFFFTSPKDFFFLLQESLEISGYTKHCVNKISCEQD